jgi:hypothetical protein
MVFEGLDELEESGVIEQKLKLGWAEAVVPCKDSHYVPCPVEDK